MIKPNHGARPVSWRSKLLLSLIYLGLLSGCWMEADVNGLNDAAFDGDVQRARELLAAGADVNGRGWDGDTPLANAVRGGHTDVVKLLLEHGADANNEFVRDVQTKDAEISELLRAHVREQPNGAKPETEELEESTGGER